MHVELQTISSDCLRYLDQFAYKTPRSRGTANKSLISESDHSGESSTVRPDCLRIAAITWNEGVVLIMNTEQVIQSLGVTASSKCFYI